MKYDHFENYASPAYGTIFAGHFNENDRYVTHRPEGMSDWLITYTLEGEGYFELPSGEHSCHAGDVTILRSGVPHRYGVKKGNSWNFIWAHFSGIYETHYLSDEEMIIESLGNSHLQDRIFRSMQHVLVDSREQSSLWQEICENEIRGILLLLTERRSSKRDPRVDEAIHYLSRHMREQIQIEDLARAIGLSSSRLSHLFKEVTGSTIIQMLNEMRIRQASILMRQAGLTASEAAYEVGFQNYNHFAALFQRQYGSSPRHYRQQGQE